MIAMTMWEDIWARVLSTLIMLAAMSTVAFVAWLVCIRKDKG